MKRLKTKSGSIAYPVGNGSIILNVSQLHILTAHTKGEFVEALLNMVGRICSNAERQQRDIRPLLVQGSGDVNGLSFPKLCQSNSDQALNQ